MSDHLKSTEVRNKDLLSPFLFTKSLRQAIFLNGKLRLQRKGRSQEEEYSLTRRVGSEQPQYQGTETGYPVTWSSIYSVLGSVPDTGENRCLRNEILLWELKPKTQLEYHCHKTPWRITEDITESRGNNWYGENCVAGSGRLACLRHLLSVNFFFFYPQESQC